MQTRFRVYDRLGAERGQLPNPLEAVWVPPLNSVPTLTIHYSLIDVRSEYLNDSPEVAFEYWDSALNTWVEPFNGRFKFFEEDFDHLEDTPTKSYTFLGVGEALLGQTVYDRYGKDVNSEGRVLFKETNAGEIVKFVWDNAVSRGWQGFTYDFTATHDSNGQPWDQVFNISYETSSNLAHILDGLVRQGSCDYVWEGRKLRLFNTATFLAREKSTGDTPVLFNLSGGPASVDGAPEMVNTENLATHVIVEGEGNLRWEFPTGAVLPEGRREVVLSYSGVDDVGTARILADPVILKSVAPLMNTTRQFHLTDETKIKPLLHYRIGDWCLIERENEYQRMRIISMSLWVNQNGVHGYVTLGDKIDDALEGMYQKIQRLTGGKANEGVGTPPMPKNRTPSLPTNLLLSAEAYPGPGGQPTGLVAISLSHNFLDTQGDPINLDHFEIQMKEVVTLPETRTWQVAARIYEPATSGTISGVDIYDIDGDIKQYDFRAYAISDESKRSGASATIRLTMVEDSVPPPVLSTPTARASGTTFTIEHDGLGSVGEEMPRDYIVSHVEMGTSETGPWTSVGRIVRRGSLTIAVDGYYTRWFRMIAEDSTGNLSDAYSGVVSATTTQLVPQATFDNAINDLNSDIGANVDETTLARDAANQALLDAEEAYNKAVTEAAQAEADAIAAAAADAQAKADLAKAQAISTAAADATTKANAAKADAATAQAAADKAAADALAASGLAGSKGKVWWETTAPLAGRTRKWSGTPHASTSQELLDGVLQRTNMFPNPSFETNINLTSSNVTRTLTTDPGDIVVGTSALRGSVVTTGNSTYFGLLIPTAPGQTISYGLNARRVSGTATHARMTIIFRDAAGATMGAIAHKAIEPLTNASKGQRLTHSAVAPAGTVNAFCLIYFFTSLAGGNPTAGDIVSTDAWIALVGATALPVTLADYFDGDSLDDRAFDLWIDTDGGNTPHRWNPSTDTWVASTDQKAIDAANAAATAQTAANNAATAAAAADGKAVAAQTAADQAQDDALLAQDAANQALLDAEEAAAAAAQAQADATQAIADADQAANDAEAARLLAVAAQSTADGKTTVSVNAPTVNDLADKPANALWTQVVGGKAVGAWYKAAANSTSWTAMPFDPVMIPQINIGTGTFGELDGVRMKLKSLGVQHLFIGGHQNLVPGAEGVAGTFGTLPVSTSVTPPGVSVIGSFLHASTASGSMFSHKEKWLINRHKPHHTSIWTYADAPNSRFYVQWTYYDRNLAGLGSTYSQSSVVMPTVWTEHTFKLDAIPTGTVYVGMNIYPNHSTGTAKANQYFAAPMMREMESGELILDGAMKARHVDTNSLTADTGFIANLKANSMVADIFQGKAFVGGTFTGTTFQSHAAALTGIKLTEAGLTAYDTTGAESFKVSSASGTGRFAGRISTTMGGAGSTLLPAAESTDGKSSGLFISKDGTLTGGITAGAWVGEVLSSNPEMLYLRGLNNGHVEVVSGTLYVRGTGQRVGNFSNWALGDQGNGSNYLPNLWINPPGGSTGYLRLTNAPTTSASANALIAITPEGVVYRSTSSIRYKADVWDYPADRRILELKPRTWVDREPMDKADPFHRYLGYIAEEVEQVMPEFVTYNDFGEPESVTYERMPSPAVIGILKEFDERLSALEGA